MSKIFKIQPSEFIDNMWEGGHVGTKLPYPFFVDEKGMIDGQDFWNGDPYRVIGFQKDLAVHKVNLWWNDAVKDPSQVVGMYLVTANKKGDFGVHQTAVSSIELLTPGAP